MLNSRPALMRAAGWLAILAALFSVQCGIPEDATLEAAQPQDDIAFRQAALTVRRGVDYSWARPSPSGLYGAGYRFAVRYLSWDVASTHGKILFRSEADALVAAGIDIVSNWEYATGDALGGYSAGVAQAREAQRLAVAAGMPATRPIYFSVDFDATPTQQTAINAYFDGVASVIGRSRTGAYGSYYVIKRLFDAGKIAWGWQTYAWSGGQWDARAQLRQVQNGVVIAGGEVDIDEAMTTDFGQWRPGGSPPPPPPPPPSSCSVRSDHRLYCGNTIGVAMRATMNTSGVLVNHLWTSPSWFDCWGSGPLHSGGNTTWYHTLGDDTSTWGWIPAVDLDTSSTFDANPDAYGLPKCPSLPSTCNVRSDGKLYCDNAVGTAMYSSLNTSSSIVNHLRTNPSWFTCWGAGALHSGGNTTWYYTLGDDTGNWGWVPAVHLSTSSTFDKNPSYYGLKRCY